ncbi:MAG: hypothetical protein ACE5GG_05660 [Candidatus Omnitrophota bacterium]
MCNLEARILSVGKARDPSTGWVPRGHPDEKDGSAHRWHVKEEQRVPRGKRRLINVH